MIKKKMTMGRGKVWTLNKEKEDGGQKIIILITKMVVEKHLLLSFRK